MNDKKTILSGGGPAGGPAERAPRQHGRPCRGTKTAGRGARETQRTGPEERRAEGPEPEHAAVVAQGARRE